MKLIDYLKKVLGSERLYAFIEKEVAEVLEKYGDEPWDKK